MTTAKKLSDREIARLRQLARGNKPEETATYEWYCEVCGKHFQFPGITSVCPRCVNAGIKHITGGTSGA